MPTWTAKLTAKLALRTALAALWIAAITIIMVPPTLAQSASFRAQQAQHGGCGTYYGKYCADSN